MNRAIFSGRLVSKTAKTKDFGQESKKYLEVVIECPNAYKPERVCIEYYGKLAEMNFDKEIAIGTLVTCAARITSREGKSGGYFSNITGFGFIESLESREQKAASFDETTEAPF